jgi:hypothetical protein
MRPIISAVYSGAIALKNSSAGQTQNGWQKNTDVYQLATTYLVEHQQKMHHCGNG